MSYFVLARKWRPQTFEEVMGQGHVTKTLQNALKNGRLAHALIFSGPRGVGKTSVARILAKALNCERGLMDNPCNQCDICKEITSGIAVDVQEIDGASNRGIDEIRQLRENIRFMPSMCRYKIYIIDEVHMLTKEAFNALLKTLEEPPPHVYFIFATTEPQKIPATINSRCQHYGFRRLGAKELFSHLVKIAEEEGFPLSKDAIFLIAREAEGSVRDSLSLLDQMAAFGATTEEDVCEALGLINSSLIKDLAKSILSGKANSIISLVDKAYTSGADIQKFVSDLVSFLRNLVIFRTCGKEGAEGLLDMDMDDMEELESHFKEFPSETLFQMLDALIKGQELVKKSSVPRVSLEIILLRLCHMREVVGIDALMEKVRDMMGKCHSESRGGEIKEGSGTYVNRRKKELSPPAVHSPMSASGGDKESFQQRWQAFRSYVNGKHPMLGALLDCCESVEMDMESEKLRLSLKPGMQRELLLERENRRNLTRYAKEFLGLSPEIIQNDFIEIERSALGVNEKKEQPPCKIKEELVNSPLVQEAIRLFQARIADVKNINKEKDA